MTLQESADAAFLRGSFRLAHALFLQGAAEEALWPEGIAFLYRRAEESLDRVRETVRASGQQRTA